MKLPIIGRIIERRKKIQQIMALFDKDAANGDVDIAFRAEYEARLKRALRA